MPYLVLWIRSGFNADPDLVFYLNAEPDQAKPMRINADPDLDSSKFAVTKS